MTPTATRTRRFQSLAAHEADMRRLHALGRCGRAIARELGCDSSAVNRRLRAMGLKPHGQRDPEARVANARRLRARCRHHGCKPGGAWMRQRQRVAALKAGWPGARCPADVRLLDAVAASRPDGLNLAGVLAASGLSYAGIRKSIRRLRHAGLLETSGVRTGKPAVYRLAAGVVPPCREGRDEA